jgi:hypothetical protein
VSDVTGVVKLPLRRRRRTGVQRFQCGIQLFDIAVAIRGEQPWAHPTAIPCLQNQQKAPGA